MKGKYVERRFGWDCHGLPIEHEIDKQLNMSASDAVKSLGVKSTMITAGVLFSDLLQSGKQRFLVWVVGWTLKMIIKQWIPHLWNPFGGHLSNYGTKT